MRKTLSKYNWAGIMIGFFVSLIITIILEYFLNIPPLTPIIFMPLISGIVSVILINITDIKVGVITGVLSIIIFGLITLPIMGLGLLLMILGAIGGLLGVMLNSMISKKTEPININESRVKSVQEWRNNLKGKQKTLINIGTIFLTIILIIGLFASASVSTNADEPTNKTTTKKTISNNTTNTPAPEDPVDAEVKQDVKKGVKNFFREFNDMYGEDGVNDGYIINTIVIDDIEKISNNQVDVSVTLTKISSNTGDTFESSWSGKLYLENGEWVDKGDFVQYYSYNQNTGQSQNY